MRVIPPIAITSGMLTSSIAEPDTTVGEVEWSAVTNYTTGTQVIRSATHKVYQRITPGGVDAGTPETSPSKWIEIGPTNRWAMFDSSRSTYSYLPSAGTITVSLNLTGLNQRADSFALIGCAATSASITVTNAGNTIYSNTCALIYRDVTDYYDYFFEEFYFSNSFVEFNVPPTINNSITFVFSVPTGGKIGGIVIGNRVDIGNIQVSPSIELLNFSKIERDIYGNSQLIPRRSVPKTVQTVMTTSSNVNKLLTTRDTLNAVPAVWAGLDDNTDKYFTPLLIFGVYKEFSISMDTPNFPMVTLQLEEV
jgi:hypothetical protein